MEAGQCSQLGQPSSQYGLSMDFYTKKFETATQATYQPYPFDSQLRTDSRLQLMGAPASTATMFSNNFNLVHSLSMEQSSSPWGSPPYPASYDSPLPTSDCSKYATPSPMIDTKSFMDFAKIPRSCPQYECSMLNERGVAPELYGSSGYAMETSNYQAQDFYQGQTPHEYSQNPRDFESQSISSVKAERETTGWEGIPYYHEANAFGGFPSSGPSEDGASVRETMDLEDLTADEPYAKLIYRALLSAPNHALALQDIYKWFRTNTTKGSSDNKGWMNSIRHNLSMNQAFRKTECRVSGDDTKKSTEWVLEDFAIREGGVQSTTRYRLKNSGAKKFTRTDNPAPARQSSGRKGGLSTSKTNKTKFQQQRQRAVKTEGHMELGPSSSARHQGIDPARRLEFQQHTSTRMMDERARTPLTPPMNSALMNPSCYYIKNEPSDDLLSDDFYRLENVQGVYMDDSPVFTNPAYGVAHDGKMEFLLRNRRL